MSCSWPGAPTSQPLHRPTRRLPSRRQRNSHPGGNANSHPSGNADSHPGGNADSHPGGNANSHPGGNANSHPGGNADSHPGGNANSHPGGNANSHPGGNADSHRGGNADSHPGGNADSYPGGNANSHPGGNALDCTEAGGQVDVKAIVEGGEVLAISITDDGIGIDAADVPHVFDRFYRTNRSRSLGVGGTGLGLAITRSIVEAHGGTIAVTSDGPGKGVSVTIRLPSNT